MKKRGLMHQPFMWIFALVVVGFLLFFGFSAVKDMIERGEFVVLSQSVVGLRNDVATVYTYDPDGRTSRRMSLPKRVDQICFVDQNSPLSSHEEKEIFESLELYNVFVLPFDSFKKTWFKIPNLKPVTNPLCIRNTGNVQVLLINKGDYVEVSKR